jgi:hypothetical protein
MTCTFLPDTTGKKYFADSCTVPPPPPAGAYYSKIMQGPLFKNCHLIAALSSLAWINNNFFPDLGETSSYLYSFCDPDPDLSRYPAGTNTPVQVTVSVNSKIFMDNSTGIWCEASSKAPETWPAMWEKAFAKFCMFKIKKNISFNNLNNAAVDPDFSTLSNGSDWGGNPVTVLKYLANNSVRNYPFLTTAGAFSYSCYSATNPYDFIKSLCDYTPMIGNRAVAGIGLLNGAKVKYPMGAWTYYNETVANRATNKNIVYNSSTISADHCYSILGIYENNGSRYIVLRNSYGAADPNLTSLGPGPWIFYNRQYSIGNLTTVTDTAPRGTSMNLSASDGIFALDATRFNDYFEGFGLIGP